MKRADYRCMKCNSITELMISKSQDFPPFIQCNKCLSNKTKRVYKDIVINVAEGKMGNSRTGYETNVTYHPSDFGKYKGKRIK